LIIILSCVSLIADRSTMATTPQKACDIEESRSPKSPLSGNPLKYDPELKGLIETLGAINSYRTFRRWKGSFLRRFESFLTEKGIEPAEDSYKQFSRNMKTFEQDVIKVQKFCEKGDLSAERTTVKGRNSLNEMNKEVVKIIQEEEELIPSTGAQEKEKGYKKYHLGAVLVRDGFSEYERMVRCDEILQELKVGGLKDVADRQQLEEIDNYTIQLQRFRDVMNDLGLYEVMMKCRQFDGGEIDEIIFLDPKTGAIIEMTREDCFKAGILSIIQDAEGNDKIREEEHSRIEKEEMLSSIKISYNL
jgi:hypothetical protein